MTGFGSAKRPFQDKTLSIEIKSVNSKIVDVRVRSPFDLKEKENLLRKEVLETAIRGKIDVSIELSSSNSVPVGLINESLLRSYAMSLKPIAEELGLDTSQIIPSLLRVPEILSNGSKAITDEEWDIIESTLDAALDRYKESNNDEGIASGDDVFLLHHAFKEDPKSVLFPKSKDLLAFTGTEPDWKSFIRQRSRWAGKTFQYKEKTMMVIWALIWISNISIIFVLLGALTGSSIMIQLLFFIIMTKFMADFIFLRTVTNYFDKSFFKYFFIAELYHVSYVIIVGINAILGIKFMWKGDKLKS